MQVLTFQELPGPATAWVRVEAPSFESIAIACDLPVWRDRKRVDLHRNRIAR